MAYPRELLNEGEELLLDHHPHWTYLLNSASMFALAVLVDIAFFVFDPRLGLVGLIVVGVIGIGVLGRFVRWQSTFFVLTTDRIIQRSGVISKSGKEIPLDRVTNISYSQTLLERMLNSGDIVVESAGEQGHQSFSDVTNPVKLQNLIYKQADIAERWNSGAADKSGRPVNHGGNQESITDQLEKLGQLHKEGVVTDREFNEKKAELLDRM